MQKNIILLLLLCYYSQIQAQVPNDLCNDAIPISLGTTCQAGSTQAATTSPDAACITETVKDVWFQYTPTISSFVSIKTNAGVDDTLFNDVLTIYTGDCDNLTTVYCFNNDKYGFQGEEETVHFSTGSTYFFRLDGQEKNFGQSEGDFCISLENYGDLAPASLFGEICNTALSLSTNVNWVAGTNKMAWESEYFPDDLARASADIWYEFTPQIGEEVSIKVQADFSHNIALYSGDCNDLILIDKNLQGYDLNVQDLSAGTNYYVQVSGTFSNLEGDYFIKIEDRAAEISDNNTCYNATLIESTGTCMDFDNSMATFSGVQPSCLFYPEADIWFRYVAPPNNVEGIKINTQADFLHGIAVYEGTCTQGFNEVFCSVNDKVCEGYLTVNNLTAGATYFVQIMTDATHFEGLKGSGCLEIIESQQGDNFMPLDLEVTSFCQSESMAELRIETSGGTGNYTFTGNTNGEELAMGSTYFVQVEDEKGCMRVATGTVDCSVANECDVFYHLTTTKTTCPTETDGTALIELSGATSPTYAWPHDNTITSNNATNLAAGNYQVTVTTDNCPFVVDIDITAPTALAVQARIKDANEGAANGKITLLPSGGTPPYTYQWTGSSLQTLEDVEEGDYAYTVVDANNCAYTSTATVMLSTVLALSDGEEEEAIEEVEETETATDVFTLRPNPFNNLSLLEFYLRRDQQVSIALYTPTGQLVQQLMMQQELEEGAHQIQIQGEQLSAGVYFVMMESLDIRKTETLVLIR